MMALSRMIKCVSSISAADEYQFHKANKVACCQAADFIYFFNSLSGHQSQ
jgi:hypothetical protein